MPDTQQPLAEDADLLQLRCASLLDAVEAVRDAQMPKGGETGAATAATDAAGAAMDAPAPDAAQDALVDVMLWTNGYLNGRAGGDRNSVPLTRNWMADNVRALAERCAGDEERYVTDVVRSM